MSTVTTLPLAGPAQLIHLGGTDTAAFAGAQFAAPLPAAATAGWAWTAWLDVAARVRMLAVGWREASGLHLLACGGDAAALAHALDRYVLRLRAELSAPPGWQLRPGAPLPLHALRREGPDGAVQLGFGSYSVHLGPAPAAPHTEEAARAAEHAAIAAGHPWLPAGASDTLLPPALGLQRLGAVVDDKGCYPGQELVNRLRQRGGHKYALMHARWPDAPHPGATVEIDGRGLGTVLRRADEDALLVLHETAAARITGLRVVRRFPP